MRFRAVAFNTITIAATIATVATGCTGSAPPKDITAPDITKIALFYPVDNLVPGRGEGGTFSDPTVSYVHVASYPLNTDDTFPVEEDGSFTFSILGISGGVIEIAGARDPKGVTRGESVYFRVPPRPADSSHFFCCQDSGVCTSDEDFERNNKQCPERDTLSHVCTSAIECRELNKEILPIKLDDISITSPSEAGLVQISGRTDTPGALMRMENRGQRSIGGRNPGTIRSVISDSTGFFRFKDLPARGDDELVFQTQDLLGFRSPEAPKLVPDAQVKDVDVLGAYAFGRLVENSEGNIVVRVHPFGVDGRGICPDSTGGPTLCFTGGLTRRMVSIDSALLQKTFPLTLTDPSPLPAGIDTDIATEGDPLKATQPIVLVMDLSENAPKNDMDPPVRFDAAFRFVRTLRKRDRLAIVSFGVAGAPMNVRRDVTFREIGSNLDYFQTYLTTTMPPLQSTGPSNVLQGVEEAARILNEDGAGQSGTIVVITMSDQVADNASAKDWDASDAFESASKVIKPDPDRPPLYKVFVVGANIPETFTPEANKPEQTIPSNFIFYVKSIADFSGGRLTNTDLVPRIVEPLDKLAGEIGGSYALLYHTTIPCTGKDPDLELTVTVNLPSGRATGTFKGSLTVDASNDPEGCQ